MDATLNYRVTVELFGEILADKYASTLLLKTTI